MQTAKRIRADKRFFVAVFDQLDVAMIHKMPPKTLSEGYCDNELKSTF